MQADNQNQFGANGIMTTVEGVRWPIPGGNDKSKKMTREQRDVQRALVMHEL